MTPRASDTQLGAIQTVCMLSYGLLAGICFTMGVKHYIADEDRVRGSVLSSDQQPSGNTGNRIRRYSTKVV